MLTEHYDIKTESGRTVAVWRSAAPTPAGTGPVVVMAPGFGQRMRGQGALALMLARNGATVYRFDSLDHVGISDGQIRDFCLGSLYESLSTVVDSACGRERVGSVSLVATSLAALPSVHYVAKEKRTDRMVLMLGVVDGRRTLLQVLGEDYLDVAPEELPDRVVIEKHEVDPRAIHREHRGGEWWDASATIGALSRLNIPVWNFAAIDDDWVRIEDVRKVFSSADLDPATRVVEVAFSGHALLRNPVALKAMMTEVTRRVIAAAPGTEPSVPSFEDMVALRGAEREFEQRHLSSRAR